MNEKLLSTFNYPLLIIGSLFSTVLRLIFPGVRHGYDVNTFAEWGRYASEIKLLYSTDCYCNYPIFGLLSSAGLLKFFDFDITQYMIALSFVDMLNVFLIYVILKNLHVKIAGAWAFVIAIIPSTWAGAALWGQIDNVGQSLLLLILVIVTIFYRRKLFEKHFTIFTIIFGVLFALTLLTKQSLWFSLLALGILYIHITLLQTRNNILFYIKFLLLFLTSIIIPIILFDLWLKLPAEYSVSHLFRVLITGSDHMDKISGNGFNIWVLLNRDLLSASNINFFWFLNPKNTGIILFVLTLIILTLILRLNTAKTKNKNLHSNFIVQYLFFLALINLSFNVFLSGTHDRYLYHFYPYLMMVIFASSIRINKILSSKKLFIALFGAFLYGAFILSILFMHQPSYSNQLLAVFHLILFVYLVLEFYYRPLTHSK